MRTRNRMKVAGIGPRHSRRKPSPRARILRIGDLGRRVASAPGSPVSSLRSPRWEAERTAWTRCWGRDWVDGVDSLARWLADAGIPVRAGSVDLAQSALGQGWGWGGLPHGISRAHLGAESSLPPWNSGADHRSRATWILRVPPGLGSIVRGRVDADPRLDARGAAPCLVVEEAAEAHLPVEPAAQAWPGREAWIRAGRALHRPFSAPPADPEDLYRRLRDGDRNADVARHPLAPEEAALAAWDLWCAASAWERDRAAWWIVRASRGFATPEESAQWDRRAADWGIRVLPPDLERSVTCHRAQGGIVRRGLVSLPKAALTLAPELVVERVRGGSFRRAEDLLRRARRRGASWEAVLALAGAGLLNSAMEVSVRSVARELRGRVTRWIPGRNRVETPWIEVPGSERRTAIHLSCLSP